LKVKAAEDLSNKANLFTKVLGYTAEETKIMVAKVKSDLVNPKLHSYLQFHFVWGRKPGEPGGSE